MKSITETHPSLSQLRMTAFVEDDGELGYSLESDGEYIQCCDVQEYTVDKKLLEKIIFEGDVRGWEDKIVEDIIRVFNLKRGDK